MPIFCTFYSKQGPLVVRTAENMLMATKIEGKNTQMSKKKIQYLMRD